MQKEPEDYNVGDETPTGNKIAKIIIKSKRVLVYLSDAGSLEYFADEQKFPHINTVGEYYSRLLSRINPEFGDRKRDVLHHHLGMSLYHALENGSGENFKDYFRDVETKIKKTKTIEEFNLYYIVYTMLYTAIVCTIGILMFFMLPTENDFCHALPLMMVAGCVGSCISVIQRNKDVKPDVFSEVFYLHYQALITIVLGGLSGILMLCAVHANLLFGMFSGNNKAIFLFSVMAGFSERFIPDLMAKLATRKNQNITSASS